MSLRQLSPATLDRLLAGLGWLCMVLATIGVAFPLTFFGVPVIAAITIALVFTYATDQFGMALVDELTRKSRSR